MGMLEHISEASDRVMATLASGLEIEFGHEIGEALAHRFLEAEHVDFLWDAREQERWIGTFESMEDDTIELDRVRILGRLDGTWFVAVIIVDGEGNPHGMMGKRTYRHKNAAQKAYADG